MYLLDLKKIKGVQEFLIFFECFCFRTNNANRNNDDIYKTSDNKDLSCIHLKNNNNNKAKATKKENLVLRA